MQHPINPLNDAGCDMLCDRLTEFTVAYENLHLDGCMERVERIVPNELFNELRAYLGSMRDHISIVCDLLYGNQALLATEDLVDECPPQGIERPMPRCPVCDVDTTLPLGCVQCEPSAEDVALRDVLDEEDVAMAEMRDKRDRLLARLDRGIITMREFQMALDPAGISQSHPCIEPGCDHTVAFDDEPYCFEHSPDEGSSVRGYSYLVYALRASQTADTVDNFIM